MREATLCYPVDGDHVLLIEKKRGVGDGLVNGPGGKLEPGETPRECVVREVEEEVGVEVAPEELGEISFTFGEEPFMFVHGYRADDPTGEPTESDEAQPMWVPVDEIPYDRMWADDRYWVPHLLDRTTFRGHAYFDADGDELLDWELQTDVELDALRRHAPSQESSRTS